MDDSISVILPVYNQEDLIGRVVKSIIDCCSDNVKELLIILDACTDGSETSILKNLYTKPDHMAVKIFKKPSPEHEILCCNTGFRNSNCRYSLNIQDDQVLTEKDFDKRLLKPFHLMDNIIAVTARDAVDVRIKNDTIDFYNVAGEDADSPRDKLYIRNAINRGPILFDNIKMKEMNYLDEDYAPQSQDDTDLSLRSYKKGYFVCAYRAGYISEPSWGSSRKNMRSYAILMASQEKNYKLLMERHLDLIMGEKHSMDIELE